MGLADDAVTGPVRLAEAIVRLEFVKTQRDEWAELLRSTRPSPLVQWFTEHPIGSVENPYVMHLPRWMADLIEEREGMTAQEYATQWCRYAVVVVIVDGLP